MPEWFKNYLDSLSQKRADELYSWTKSLVSESVAYAIRDQLEKVVTTDRRPQ